MHALGVPTTRSLCVALTGDTVQREADRVEEHADDRPGHQLLLELVRVIAAAQAGLAVDGSEFCVQVAVVGLHRVAVEDVESAARERQVQEVEDEHEEG